MATAKLLKKSVIETDVWTLGLERMRELYRRFDHVWVSFSGGKDSTVALELSVHAARELGRLPVNAFFWDEEAIHPPTIEYVLRTHAREDVNLRWLAIPHKHRNACSRKHPWWYPWDPTKRELWCREPPPFAEREFPGYSDWLPIPLMNGFIFPIDRFANVAIVVGLRAAESLRRYMVVARRETDNWMSVDPACKWATLAKPVYDWTTADVWTAPKRFGWDYNRTYDHQTMLGTPRHDQRVCPPFGEEPLTQLWKYAQAWPELWEKMVRRVPGAATAARYSNSPLYAMREVPKPDGLSWKEAITAALDRWDPATRAHIAARIQKEIRQHNQRTGDAPIPEHSTTGICWRFLLQVATRGDIKERKHTRYDKTQTERPLSIRGKIQ